MFRVLLDKIGEIIQANDLIQEYYLYEVEQFEGDPTCTVTPSANEGDYETTDENVRIYAFNIRIFVNRDIRTKQKADEILAEIVNSVIDTFDKDYTLSGIEPPTGYIFINSFVLPSNWGYSGREDEYRVAELSLKCRVSVDLSAI